MNILTHDWFCWTFYWWLRVFRRCGKIISSYFMMFLVLYYIFLYPLIHTQLQIMLGYHARFLLLPIMWYIKLCSAIWSNLIIYVYLGCDIVIWLTIFKLFVLLIFQHGTIIRRFFLSFLLSFLKELNIQKLIWWLS